MPPYFLNTSSASDADVTVREYSNASLDCKAAANPAPVVTWRREDGQSIPAKIPAKGESLLRQRGCSRSPLAVSLSSESLSRPFLLIEVRGDLLKLYEVTRLATGVYECIVTSGVSPPISRRITLLVLCM